MSSDRRFPILGRTEVCRGQMAVYKERTDKSGCGGSAEGRQGEEERALFRKEGDIVRCHDCDGGHWR